MKNKLKGWDNKCGIYRCSLENHLSFWLAIIKQPEWELWCKEIDKRMVKRTKEVFDVVECSECGWMSEKHAKEFLQFVKTLKK
jgi:ribosomal protein L37AE/L43A